MNRLTITLSVVVSAILMTGCVSDYQSSSGSDPGTSNGPEPSNAAQEAIDRDNIQAANNQSAADAAARAAEDSAATQATMNNANNSGPPNN
jgi:hypothetical protein